MKVIRIDYNCSSEHLDDLLSKNLDCKFVHYKHECTLGKGESLLTEARRNKNSHNLLLNLANRGFYQYMTKDDNVSSFVQHKELPILWNLISRGEAIYNEDGLVYAFDGEVERPTRLLVIFSSINAPIYKVTLDRIFTKNFKNIRKYIGNDTAVMRIADLGGITGSYYLNSKYLPNNESNIQKLIVSTKKQLRIEKVVLLGASKGGSAAFYHGLLGGYDFVAVDPIVTDEFYFNNHNDLHFMKGIADGTKEDSFVKLLKETYGKRTNSNNILITSKRSPQYKYISRIVLDNYADEFSIYINTDPAIKSHPDVSPKSLLTTTNLVNSCLNDIKIKRNLFYFIDTAECDKNQKIKNDSNRLPENWKDELALLAKESREKAVEYLDDFHKRKINFVDSYYWHYAIHLRAIRDYEKCRLILDEGEDLFPESRMLKESKGALYFDLRNYEFAFNYFKEAFELKNISEKSHVKFLFSSLVAGSIDDIKYVCRKYLDYHGVSIDAFIYYLILSEIESSSKINVNLLKDALSEFFHKNKISLKYLDFIAERFLLENTVNFDIDLFTDIPNSKYKNILQLYNISKNSLFKKFFLYVSRLIFLENKVLKSCSLEAVGEFLSKSFDSSESFLKEIRFISILEKKAIIYILYKAGDFNLAYLVRKMFCKEIEFSGAEKNPHSYMLARVDSGAGEEDFNFYCEKYSSENEWLNNVYPCLKIKTEIGREKIPNEDDYFYFLKDKRIAIVAPVNTGLSSGFEINNFDVVIRFNYKGSEKLGLQNIFGSKTNIGYYNLADIPSEFDKDVFDAMMSLDFVVVPASAIRQKKWIEAIGGKLRVRYECYSYESNPLIIGYANAIQRALMDIIRYPYKEIKVFNANFYLDNKINSEYRNSKFSYKNGFCYHEPLSNFNYVFQLWKNKWIEVDDCIRDIFLLGKEYYINKISKDYGIDIFEN